MLKVKNIWQQVLRAVPLVAVLVLMTGTVPAVAATHKPAHTAVGAHHRTKARRAGARTRRRPRRGITRATLRKRTHELKVQLNQKQAQIQAQQNQIQALVTRGMAISEQIHQDELAEQDASMRLSDGQFKLKQLDISLCNSLARLDAAKKRLALDRANLKLRVRDVYEQGNVGILQVLLNSRNVMDFMNRREYVSRVVNRDLGIVQRVRLDEAEIDAESRALAAERAAKAQEVQQIQVQNLRLQQAISNRVAILQSTEQQAETARESMAEMEGQSSSIQSMLQRLQSMPILTVSGAGGRRLRYQLHWSGRFLMPVQGYVTSPFGYRFHPILHVYKLHTGVDIGAPWGTPVHAAASGVVVHAGWLGGYGNAVIIDHGDGLATLYGHMSRLNVISGQPLAAGAVIGFVGSTGLSTGPHLHFEARKYGTPVPPF